MFAFYVLRGESPATAKVATYIELNRLIFIFPGTSFNKISRHTIRTHIGRTSLADFFGRLWWCPSAEVALASGTPSFHIVNKLSVADGTEGTAPLGRLKEARNFGTGTPSADVAGALRRALPTLSRLTL